jgi:hypothetical protein
VLSFLAAGLDTHVALLANATGTDGTGTRRSRYLSALGRLALDSASPPVGDERGEAVGERARVAVASGPGDRRVVATTGGCDPEQVPSLSGGAADRACRVVEAGLSHVRDRAPYGRLVDTLIARVVLAGDDRIGASSSRVHLGTVVMCPPPDWDHRHVAVSLVHEATHQALFLADLVRRVFAEDPAVLDGLTATSAVRGVPRPYDLAFHSAAVAVTIAPLAHDLGVMQPSAARVASCVEELRARGDRALTGYGVELLEEIDRAARLLGTSPCRT